MFASCKSRIRRETCCILVFSLKMISFRFLLSVVVLLAARRTQTNAIDFIISCENPPVILCVFFLVKVVYCLSINIISTIIIIYTYNTIITSSRFVLSVVLLVYSRLATETNQIGLSKW